MQKETWYDPEAYYTALVTLTVSTEDKKKEFSYLNIKGSQLPAFKQKGMVEGFVYTLPDTGMIELISPLKIKQILITEQKEGVIRK